ncbi:hypothetical protein ACFRCG_44605 [Embleya sp. NPDC056575]|uniref:hypothetical protein n=1 Tax=unclassified Embleya TaxID=2699296 RepID=UPI0036BCB4EA
MTYREGDWVEPTDGAIREVRRPGRILMAQPLPDGGQKLTVQPRGGRVAWVMPSDDVRRIPPPPRPGRIGVGDKAKHTSDSLRRTHPPGTIEHIDPDTGEARVQPFDPAQPAWTASLDLLVPDDGVWFPSDGAPPARSRPFPIPPGAAAPRAYGCYRL